MRREIVIVMAALLLMGTATRSFAQASVGVRGYVTYGSTWFAAKESFEAVADTSTQTGIGGGGSVSGLWRGLFVDVGMSQQSLDGERVFLNSDSVYRLGVPLTVTLRPIDVAAGWRFFAGRLSPYVAGGVTFVSYEETASFAEAGDDVSEQKSGGLVLGGVDLAIIRWLHVGGEVRYRAVSGVLGVGGVSAALGDDQLGGILSRIPRLRGTIGTIRSVSAFQRTSDSFEVVGARWRSKMSRGDGPTARQENDPAGQTDRKVQKGAHALFSLIAGRPLKGPAAARISRPCGEA